MRSVRLAYVIPPLLAVVLAFLGATRLSESGVVGVSSVVTAVAERGTMSNGRIAVSLEDVARRHQATVVRTVADRSAPTARRTALVTAAPGTDGAEWLRDGYADFSRTVRTTVRPMAALDRYDPAGSYEVIGDDGAGRATAAALQAAGFTTSSESVPVLDRLGVAGGVQGTSGLVGCLVLGCVTLCLVGTVGSPRRTAVRGLHGRSAWAIVGSELSEARTTVLVVLVPQRSRGVGDLRDLGSGVPGSPAHPGHGGPRRRNAHRGPPSGRGHPQGSSASGDDRPGGAGCSTLRDVAAGRSGVRPHGGSRSGPVGIR